MALARVNTPTGGSNLIKVVLPTQNGTLTYNGTNQTPTWMNYNPDQMTMTGETEATNAGVHAVYCTPTGNCVWANGTQETKETTWTMNKAAGVLSLSANSAEIKVGFTNNVILTTAGDGAIAVTSNNTSVATVSRNGNTITITGVKAGSATITVSVAEGTNHLAPSNVICSVTVSKTSVTIPTITNTSKTYNGSSQSPTVTNEPSSTVATCTGKSATNAGDYTLKYVLTDTNKYMWSDGSISDKSTAWSIAKADVSLILSSNSGNIYKNTTATFTITAEGDGAITVVSSNTSIATVSKSGNTVTITGVNEGTTTITVSQAAGTNHNAPENKTYTVTVKLSVNDFSWAQISTISKNGQGDLYFDIGDAKEITLNGKIGSQLTLSNTKLCVFILHFNYEMNGTAENNIIWGGFKSAITGGKDVALVDAEYTTNPEDLTDGTVNFTMNHHKANPDNYGYGTNYGGWKGSDLRYDILGATSTQPSEYNQVKSDANVGYDATASTLTNPKADTLLAALPSDFRNALRLWTRWVDAVGNDQKSEESIKATVDAVTLLAEYEVFKSTSYSNSYEKNHQTQMSYYSAGNGPVRYKHNDTAEAVSWWECSPYGSIGFCYVRPKAYGSSYKGGVQAFNDIGIAPAFKT